MTPCNIALETRCSLLLFLSLSSYPVKQKGKVIEAGRAELYRDCRINASPAIISEDPTRTALHGSSVYRMLSAALCTVIKDHLQSFIISCSLSEPVSLCGPTRLSIHLSPSPAMSVPSHLLFRLFLTIYIYLKHACFLQIHPRTTTILHSPFPLLYHMPVSLF